MREDIAIFTAYDDFCALDSAEAEKNLMRAILKSAMDDMGRTGEMHREAREFFMCPDDHYLFSFLSICHHLELCPHTIRWLLGISSRVQNKQERKEVKLAA